VPRWALSAASVLPGLLWRKANETVSDSGSRMGVVGLWVGTTPTPFYYYFNGGIHRGSATSADVTARNVKVPAGLKEASFLPHTAQSVSWLAHLAIGYGNDDRS
jgi:hypothetical protein